jgi:methylamine---corrinoid protein Co-methyltransferase
MAGPGTKAQRERMSVFEAYERARKGPKVDEAVWNFEIIPQTAKRLKEKYEIVMDKSVMVPTDPELISKLYKAGLEMLVECGVYVINTGRVIKYTEAEVLLGAATAPKECVIGEGLHARKMQYRTHKDTRPPLVQGGPTGAPCSEKYFFPIHESYAKEGIVDCIVDGVLASINGYNPAPDSPWEVLAGRQEAMMVRMAQAKCGRSGMGL